MLIIKKKLLASIIDLKSEISNVGIVDKPNNFTISSRFSMYDIDSICEIGFEKYKGD